MSIMPEILNPTEMTVLIVDDTKENIKVLQRILAEEGYKIGVALSGIQALKNVSKLKPDLILLDVMMPEMDGFETCRRLKSNPETKDISVIFLTAKTEMDDVSMGFEVGAVDYITKPFLDKDICVRVKTHLKLSAALKQLLLQSTKDPLTDLFNRRSFNEKLEGEYKRSLRGGEPFSLIFLDIDFFKNINDTYGHSAGDKVIQEVGKFLNKIGRGGDEVCRWGGEEFLIFLPGTSLKGAAEKAEKIREGISSMVIEFQGSKINLTMSLGVGTFQTYLKLSQIIDMADKNLYRAKNRGRNCVVSEEYCEEIEKEQVQS